MVKFVDELIQTVKNKRNIDLVKKMCMEEAKKGETRLKIDNRTAENKLIYETVELNIKELEGLGLKITKELNPNHQTYYINWEFWEDDK